MVIFRVKCHEYNFIYYNQSNSVTGFFSVLYVILRLLEVIPKYCISQALYFKIIFEKRIPSFYFHVIFPVY
jgi:hypothetical protein